MSQENDARDRSVPEEHHVIQASPPLDHADLQKGHWMSQDRRHHHKFLNDTVGHVDKNPKPLHPVLLEFKEMVERDTRLYMLFQAMFEEVSANGMWLSVDPEQQKILDRPDWPILHDSGF
jgi:phosphatidylserine decarboxylase